MSVKLQAGDFFPDISVLLDDEPIKLHEPMNDCDWQAIFVYRGRHCPMCTKYLNSLETIKDKFYNIGVSLLAVSGDSKHQLTQHQEQLEVSFPLAYDLSQSQMQELGLYISIPRSEQETDHQFSEPGLFVVNQERKLHVVDISNNPFVRPELETLVNGLKWIRDPKNNYPIRGTAEYN